jgi:hypothetical protein
VPPKTEMISRPIAQRRACLAGSVVAVSGLSPLAWLAVTTARLSCVVCRLVMSGPRAIAMKIFMIYSWAAMKCLR